jgi:glutamyl-tRNA(Gln) amidotransferase subunit D
MESGDRIKIDKDGIAYEGILVPSTGESIVLKLDNGYNVGFREGEILSIERVEKREGVRKRRPKGKKNLPSISILSTGGTIASKVDYRTGAVTSQFTAEEIIDAIPELEEIANYNANVIYNIFSENMRAKYWTELAREVYDEIKRGADGVIVTHGTDTMTYTAVALSFMLIPPVPIVLVGSQRSADRPSSDNAVNAISAARVATSDIAEVTVVMHGSTSDEFCYIHRGTKIRKMHTSARDAFSSINERPVGRVYYDNLRIEITDGYKKRGERELELRDHLEEKCCLIKFYPGANPEIIDFYREKGYRGIVIEGTGLGHVSNEWIPRIEHAVKEGISIVMTSQCIYGRVCCRVYDTGRDLLKSGVIEGEDMLSETALVKLMWVLGMEDDPEEVRRLMQQNIAGEITESTIFKTSKDYI